MRHAFITGSAGFIGYHLASHLLQQGWRVTGYDGLNDYYDVSLKQARHARLRQSPDFAAHEARLEDFDRLDAAIAEARPDAIVHLAAQAGVRYSIDNPRAYLESNLIGTFNLMEAALKARPAHLLMASTSSVYGANTEARYAETHKADSPMSFYAATKKANEAMAHAWAHIHGLPITMFRFFTVYGPWGRPDMALFKFTKAILEGRPIDVYNHGEMWRDFTYVTDLVRAIGLLIDCPPPLPGTLAPLPGGAGMAAPVPGEANIVAPVPEASNPVAPVPGASNLVAPVPGASNLVAPVPEASNPVAPVPGAPNPLAPVPGGPGIIAPVPVASNPVAPVPGDSLSPVAPWRVVNIGNSESVRLTDFIDAIEVATGRTSIRNLMEMQPGDVPRTWADAELLRRLTGYAPQTSLAQGVAAFVEWYRGYYRV